VKVGRRTEIISGIAFAVVSCTSGPAPARDLYIRHVTVVSPEGKSPANDVTVRIHGDRIASISRRVVPSSNTDTVIDGTGLFLSPGLIDSHVHTDDLPGFERAENQLPQIARALR